ncbi:MAG: ABC transporter ATP-binding protein [Moraxellaceae bacterium]|nr:ABC transporter ATP-binding protein [Moraxellaceae bacterium]
MFKLIKELFNLLTPNQRSRFYTLQALVILMAITEIAGVAAIVPFMALVGDMSLLQQDTLIAQIYNASGISTEAQFVFLLGVGVLVMLFLSALISMLTTWRLAMFASQVGTEIADRLYSHYLKQGWLFHATGSSAQLTKQIANESTRVTNFILQPLMHMNARIALGLLMSIAIFIYDPMVAIVGLVLFAVAYAILFKIVRARLQRNGKAISSMLEQRFRLMNEGFGGIKDVLLLGRDADFIDRFNQTGKTLAYSQGTNGALAQVPRYLMELIAFGAMIGLVLYLIASHQGNLGLILPILSVYALAGFKLLPAFQQIYSSMASIKGNVASFEAIKPDLMASQQTYQNANLNQSIITKPAEQTRPIQTNLHPKQAIELNHITFTYPSKSQPALNNLSLRIQPNSVIGLVGPSGSGKSTLIDILLGLITPQQGEFKIDDTVIDKINLRAWQNTIGFVPQSIFLSEGTIAENVAFGIPKNQIDEQQVNKAIKLAHLEEFVQSLEQGIYTKVGERGVQLSGGQCQRIGIARALYHDASVLVFDEATSALDGITERLIMEAIHDFSGQKTIIMIAHRLKTVEQCDQIFLIENGSVVDKGNYTYLIKSNENFKRMAMHS